jgi:hypothetical protein
MKSSLLPPDGMGVLPVPENDTGSGKEPVGDSVYEEIVYGSDTETGRRTIRVKPV